MKIAVIGCGVMGSAFARHFVKKYSVVLFDRNLQKIQKLSEEIGGRVEKDLLTAIEGADVIFLSVKPKDLKEVAAIIGKRVTKTTLVISILAGTTVAQLKHCFPQATVIRAMPNLALLAKETVMGLVLDESHTKEVRKRVDTLFEGIGFLPWMEENKLEALTALSGSGIAFVLVMIEAMIDSGVFLGFNPEESRAFVLQTVQGAVALLNETEEHPAELRQQISSPGGTTIVGLKIMEEKGVRSGIFATIVACYEKALSMRSTF